MVHFVKSKGNHDIFYSSHLPGLAFLKTFLKTPFWNVIHCAGQNHRTPCRPTCLFLGAHQPAQHSKATASRPNSGPGNFLKQARVSEHCYSTKGRGRSEWKAHGNPAQSEICNLSLPQSTGSESGVTMEVTHQLWADANESTCMIISSKNIPRPVMAFQK